MRRAASRSTLLHGNPAFASAHPGGRGEQVKRVQLVVGHRVEEAAQLVARPHADRSAAAADRGRIGGVGHVADDGALAGRVGHRALQGGVDVAHRLGRQAASAAVALALGEELDVQLVEVLGLEPLKRDGPDVGVDVQPDVALIRVGGRGLHPGPLRRQPPMQQVVGNGDLVGRPVVAVVHPLDDLREQLLGLASGCAGRVPAVAGLARRGVRALVDDHVVAVALLGDVPSHREPFAVDAGSGEGLAITGEGPSCRWTDAMSVGSSASSEVVDQYWGKVAKSASIVFSATRPLMSIWRRRSKNLPISSAARSRSPAY